MQLPASFDETEADRLLDHIDSPYHKGEFSACSHRQKSRNPLCGDEIELQVLIDDGYIREAWFEGRGCSVSIGAASILCEYIEGMRISDVQKIEAAEFVQMLGASISPVRQRCALLAFETLRSLQSVRGK